MYKANTYVGLLARGLSAIGQYTSLEGWRWILIIEGLIVRQENLFLTEILNANITQTVVVGIISYIGLPNSAGTAWFLNDEERDWAVKRLEYDIHGRFRYITAIPNQCLFLLAYRVEIAANKSTTNDLAGLKSAAAYSTSRSGLRRLPTLPFYLDCTLLVYLYGFISRVAEFY